MQPKKWCLANAFAAYYKFNAYQLHPPPYPYNIFLPVLGFNNVDVVVRARTSILQHLSAKHVGMYVSRTHIRQNLKLGTVSSSQASSKIIAYLFTGRNLGKQIITMLRQLIVVSYLFGI